jgi:hypothetical protein
VQRPLMCGPNGWPAGQNPWPTDPTLYPLMSFLSGDTLQNAVERNLRPRVSGGYAPWPWRITDLIKSVIAPGTPINTPCQCNLEQHTLLVVLQL